MLGAGNTGFAVAANLTLAGHSVTLGELPAFPEAIAPVRESRTIDLLGVAHTGAAEIAAVTDDVAAAAAASDTLMVIVPAYGQAPWAEALGPPSTRRSHPDPDARNPGGAGSRAHPA